MYGRRPPDPTYTADITETDEVGSKGEFIRLLRHRINVFQQLAHESQQSAAKREKTYSDAFAEAHTFREGDIVWWYKQSSAERGVTSKMALKWKGPFIISKVHGPVTYSIKDDRGNVIPQVVHSKDLYKPY